MIGVRERWYFSSRGDGRLPDGGLRLCSAPRALLITLRPYQRCCSFRHRNALVPLARTGSVAPRAARINSPVATALHVCCGWLERGACVCEFVCCFEVQAASNGRVRGAQF